MVFTESRLNNNDKRKLSPDFHFSFNFTMDFFSIDDLGINKHLPFEIKVER